LAISSATAWSRWNSTSPNRIRCLFELELHRRAQFLEPFFHNPLAFTDDLLVGKDLSLVLCELATKRREWAPALDAKPQVKK